jgi:hypothetical protein
MDMALRRTLTALLIAALATAGAAALLGGCEKSPSAPEFDNIFDPDGPENGQPLHLTASLSGTKITLSWTQPQGFGISYYQILHSLSLLSEFLPVGSVEHSDNTFGTFNFENASPTATHYFKIQAFDAEDNFTSIADQAPAIRSTPPRVTVNGGATRIASRNITLNVLVTAGDSLRVSNRRDFVGESRLASGESGQTLDIPWTLAEAASNDTNLTVRVLAFPLAGFADTAKVTLDVDFTPDFTVAGDPASVATRVVALEIPMTGVVSMRFADSEEALADLPWLPGSANPDYPLANSANPQTVWGEFLGDFGFTHTGSITVTPDLLTEASFALDLPVDRVTDQSTVTVLADAVATQMRFSESLDFSQVPWTAYADTSSLELSADPGRKVLYGQFRNEWSQSAILTDFVIYLSQPLEVAILAPVAGSQISSGTTLQVLGSSTAPAFSASVDSVRFDSGAGFGFQPVSGTESWSFLWDVPAVTENTERVLRARAWAAGDSVTTAVSVTLTPGEAP